MCGLFGVQGEEATWARSSAAVSATVFGCASKQRSCVSPTCPLRAADRETTCWHVSMFTQCCLDTLWGSLHIGLCTGFTLHTATNCVCLSVCLCQSSYEMLTRYLSLSLFLPLPYYLACRDEEQHNGGDNEKDLEVLDGVATIVDYEAHSQANNQAGKACQGDGLEAALGTHTCSPRGELRLTQVRTQTHIHRH